MRTAFASLLTLTGLVLATPAVAVSWSAHASSADQSGEAGGILLYDRPIDVSALLGCEELNIVAPNFIHRAHAPGSEISWSRLLAVWKERFGSPRPTLPAGHPSPPAGNPSPAIPEPGAALVFAAGLLLARHRRS